MPQCCAACTAQTPALDACAAALHYAYPWDQLLASLKFQSHPGLARALARRWLDEPLALDLLHQASAVVPVPLSSARLATRGYNQSLLLTKHLLQQSGHQLPVLTRALVRREPEDHPDTQVRLSREQRMSRMRRAFTPDPTVNVAGQHLLLIDDVMTTGATLFAAAQALKDAGAARVSALTLARTGLD